MTNASALSEKKPPLGNTAKVFKIVTISMTLNTATFLNMRDLYQMFADFQVEHKKEQIKTSG